MCGIAGQIRFGGGVEVERIKGVLELLHHRGPDEVGVYGDGEALLGHTRLSIVDLAGGHQPMTNEDGRYWITFNGEIFNYIELRRELEAAGHRFATSCDTEVILHAYEEKGPECVKDFNGQWAFAIWDKREKVLFLSRDRMGVRPLFYHEGEGEERGKVFTFSSEIKGILGWPGVRREIDIKGLDQLFTFWCTLPPRTVYRGISELPAGCSMLVREGEARWWRHWGASYEMDEGMEEKRGAEELLGLLLDATKLRLRADVPVGAYLSGGLDSSVIAGLINEVSVAELCTFSVTFAEGEFDESAYQREVVRKLGTKHEAVGCENWEIGGIFPQVIWNTERPVVRTAPAPLWKLSGLVRRNGYKVVLTGEGSDEILGGYDIFKEAKIRRFWGRNMESKWRPLLLKRLYPYLENVQNQPEAYRRAFFRVGREDMLSPFFSHLPRWDLTARVKGLFSKEVRGELEGYDCLEELRAELPREFGRWHPFCQAQYLETALLLPGYILSSQGDRMGMAHSVEGRFPFLDHRVVAFGGRMPVGLKMKGLEEKYLLKKAAGHLVPDVVRKRTKQPYRAPEAMSFLGEAGKGYVEEVLSEGRIREAGIFNPAAVGQLRQKAEAGRLIGIKDNMAFVGVLSTQLVWEQFIRNFGRLTCEPAISTGSAAVCG